MERSSRVIRHGNPKILFFFQKSSKLKITCILTCAEELKSTFKLVSTCTSMSTSGMHRRPFEGRHLVQFTVGSSPSPANAIATLTNRPSDVPLRFSRNDCKWGPASKSLRLND